MLNIIIIGAGGHGQVVADILLAGLKVGRELRPVGYADDDPGLAGQTRLGLPVLGRLARLSEWPHQAVVLGIGANATRHRLAEQLKAQGERLVSALHPSAILGTGVEIGTGTVICAGVVVNPGTWLGEGVILNTACSVDHHNRLGDYAHIAPGAHLGGDVEIGAGTLIGIGATVMPQRRVGAWSTVGAGAVVTRNLPSGVTAVGVPARVV